jgi:GTP-binding protein
MFIDEVSIYVRSGRGGNGSVHFHREKFVPRGGPDGGDGGNGGSILFKVVPTLNTLVTFQHKAKYIGENGKSGGKNRMTGRSADNMTISVPPGTIVYDENTGEPLGDLVENGQTLLLCKGGRGGRGNCHFVNSRDQAPRTGEKGEPGEEKWLRLELKLIADIGIIGVPNAGKSSFLAAVTNAKPKIADYPFTTLEPNLGVHEFEDQSTMVLADIPGLIEGAHEGAGLGYAFLRHIQRTRVLIHVLDGMSDDPLADFTQINSELALFDPQLGKKPQVITFNKMDIPEVQEKWKKIEKKLKKYNFPVISTSTMTRDGLNDVLLKAAELLQSTPLPEPVAALPVYKPEEGPRDFKIEKVEEGWKVTGKAIERAAEMTYWEHEGSVRRFQRLMATIGLDEALRTAGIREGETVFIGENELEWQD